MDRLVRGFGVAMIVGIALLPPPVGAEEDLRTLPTLLIKGEIVSLDTADPSATLLKVKDRYGFETPIFLSAQTTLTQGGQPATVDQLTAGAEAEVEYNFDINTAKRHAVSVTLTAPTPAAAAPAPEAVPAPAAATATIEAQTPPASPDTTAAPAEPAAAVESKAPAAVEEAAPATP